LEKFSLLSKEAKRIICVKGASTATERDFSASGLVILFGIEEMHDCRKK